MLPLKQWHILNNSPLASVVEIILKNRNLSETHLAPFKLSDRLHDPFLLDDMDKAVSRIMHAVESREQIAIFGDYDVDGMVSTTLMIKLFHKLNLPVKYYLPNRTSEGYGLKVEHIRQALTDNITLLITVDNGISSVEAISEAGKQGIDVIVTDHHIQKNELPPAFAVINPNRTDSHYPFKGICGAGVVYKLFQALLPKILGDQAFKNFMLTQLDLVALATIADVVPLVDENYALVKFGLKSLTNTKRPGLIELKRISGLLGKAITPIAVGYYLAPRLNVAGRLEDADISIQLLLAETIDAAANLASYLNKLNYKRQQLQEEYLTQALLDIEKKALTADTVIIVENEQWEAGLLGLIAGKLKDRFTKPAIAFTVNGDANWVGSARSLAGINITELLTIVNHLLLNYGGHEKAAGLTVSAELYDQFKQDFIKQVNTMIDPSLLKENLIIDTVISPDQLTKSLVQTISSIGPFGEGNSEPVLLLQHAFLEKVSHLSGGKHLKFIVRKGGQSYECVWWNKGAYQDAIQKLPVLDIAFTPEINIWQGRENLQLCVEDVREAVK
jgi:single-stranded-DNA-specific exonuclease